MKFLLRVILLVGSISFVAACGSGGGSQFAGGLDSGGLDATLGDGPKLVLGGDSGGGNKTLSGACNPLTCAKLGYNCGVAGDGCGGSLNCGTCTGTETCGGGGKFSVCGGTTGCAPKTCAGLGIGCGPAGDGCGGALDCGTCSGIDTCGGGGTPNVCGSSFVGIDGGIDGGGLCIPQTCASQSIGCGPAGDGCGNSLNCGSCPIGQSCGGGRTPSACGAPSCTPKTCLELGISCGPAGDGCGGSLSCGGCTAPESCGGGGTLSQCGGNCTNLCLSQDTCEGGTTTITGQVVAATPVGYLPSSTASPDPVPNVIVYVPNGTPSAFTPGVQCSCGVVTGSPLAVATTNYLGMFTLTNVPVPPSGVIPLVIQLGRWRRIFGLGNANNPGIPVTCGSNTLSAPLTMPSTHLQGDIPFTAISTGQVDPMECVLLKMGVASTEFTAPGGGGRIEVYKGNGAIIGTTLPYAFPETTLVPNETVAAGGTTTLDKYDQVLFPCWGQNPATTPANAKTVNQQNDVIAYTGNGGRVFATHFSYSWLYNAAAVFSGTVASWNTNDPQFNTGTATIVQPSTAADINTFYLWMNALTWNGATAGSFSVTDPRNDFNAPVTAADNAELWMNASSVNAADAGVKYPLTYTFPVSGTALDGGGTTQCGKVIYSDFHVSLVETASGPSTTADDTNDAFPAECTPTPMSAQEKALEYLIWDLASCSVTPPVTCQPATCASLGYTCGPAGDGCGGTLECGSCSDAGCQTCGGGGVPGVCGGSCCVPTTCTSQGISCGPAGDGCGGSLNCGTCPAGEVCGGGGTPGVCGAPDSAACVPLTCAGQGINCGPAGDGCGGSLSCGTCPAGQTCGGGGQPGVCGSPTCTPKTCEQLGFDCGPAGDGCGGSLNCGTCTAPNTCGGGGSAGVCGAPSGPK
jgi:hypothetical protein